MNIALVILTGSLVFTLFLYVSLKNNYQSQLKINQQREETIRLLQRDDIQELLSHVRSVFAGEIVYERDPEAEFRSPLTGYSFHSYHRERSPAVYKIEYNVTVLEINLDRDKGELVVFYFLSYLDSDGNPLRGVAVDPDRPTRWIIERQEGKWVVVEIQEYKHWLSLQDE